MGYHPGRSFVLGAMIGSTLGALTAAALTSKKGSKIKKQLMSKYHEFDTMMQELQTEKSQRKVKRELKARATKAAKKWVKKRARAA